jgi:hypothetical protein
LADDRFEEIRRLLHSTISEFQSLFQSASGFEETRVGNGWTPDSIEPEIYYVEPKPASELIRAADTRKRSLFRKRIFSILRPGEDEVAKSPLPPKLRLIPFWRIKGFHECFYFRGNSYKVALPDDVIAVEIEGKVRDIVGEESTEPQRIANLTKRLLGMRDSSMKSIRLGEVTELAYMYKDDSLFVNADGKEDLEAEAFFEGNIPLRKVTPNELGNFFPNAEIVKGSVSKDDLIRRFHSLVVKPPLAFTRILSNRFQITELAELLMPAFTFEYSWRGLSRHLTIHGFTGAALS